METTDFLQQLETFDISEFEKAVSSELPTGEFVEPLFYYTGQMMDADDVEKDSSGQPIFSEPNYYQLETPEELEQLVDFLEFRQFLVIRPALHSDWFVQTALLDGEGLVLEYSINDYGEQQTNHRRYYKKSDFAIGDRYAEYGSFTSKEVSNVIKSLCSGSSAVAFEYEEDHYELSMK